MTNEKDLIRALAEHPDDTAPLSSYINYLTNRGDPRGEVIRLQTEAAALAEDDRRRDELEAIEQALWRGHAPDVLRDLVRFPRPAEAFWQQLLWHRSYRTDLGIPPHAIARFRSPVRHVKLESELSGKALLELVNCPWFICLSGFDLPEYDYGGHGVEGARTLAGSPYLARLISLQVAMNEIGDRAVSVLAASPYLSRVAFLGLGGNDVAQAGVQALASSPYLNRLVFLDLDSVAPLGDPGPQALAASPNVASLSFLDLGINVVGDRGAQAFAASPHLTNLMSLKLQDNYIRDTGAEALAASPTLANLASLNPGYNNLSTRVVELLRRRFGDGVQVDPPTD
jgi:uncharacterized protein (TIGR02996 family)